VGINNNSSGHLHQQLVSNNKKNKSHHYEMPFVVNRFYFHHEQGYPGSPFLNPDKKVISLKLFDRGKGQVPILWNSIWAEKLPDNVLPFV
jgi:hypothetical protein